MSSQMVCVTETENKGGMKVKGEEGEQGEEVGEEV